MLCVTTLAVLFQLTSTGTDPVYFAEHVLTSYAHAQPVLKKSNSDALAMFDIRDYTHAHPFRGRLVSVLEYHRVCLG
ncbi:hypothetical protein RRG08_002318 [Elysia crispata]|uniref:Uncharacterized protein n=1 Tax=Elysia crispata TaxID=231223 RepID=A0AAE1DD56_9GAST|nr:hypothetical protein RRG08_002318 [Elysia crispata]